MVYRQSRAKLSTTLAPENYRYLAQMVKSGKAASLAEAVDEAVESLRRIENRRRLAQATAAYFESLSDEAMAEENSLSQSLSDAAKNIDFDHEP
jgi:hypothetical protein